jgi:thermitase
MIKLLNRIMAVLLLTAAGAPAAEQFRLDQEKLWLTVSNVPLADVLEEFTAAGVEVQVAPGIEKTVSGEWDNVALERALDEILSPFNYLLDWRREPGHFGPWTRLTRIRLFRDGESAAVQPLPRSRRIETAPGGSLRFIAREILIGFRPGATPADLAAFLARTGGTVIASNPELGVYRILLPEGVNIPELARQLANDPSIGLAEPNYIYDLPEMKPVDLSGATLAGWSAPEGGTTRAVSVLDSGLISDERLSQAVIGSFDATRPDSPLIADAVGHGTLMARLAAGLVSPGQTETAQGVPVLAVKAFADDGTADSFTLMSAMTYAVENSSGPISLSWGTETPSRFLETAVNYAASRGSLIVAAVGNENTGRPMYPAAYPSVLAVAAAGENGYADYSNRGDFVDLIAPGSISGGAKGTSVSTAYVSYLAALYQQAHPSATAQDTVRALQSIASPEGFLPADARSRLLQE